MSIPNSREAELSKEELFFDAIQITEPARTRFLRERCGEDLVLFDELNRMCAAHDRNQEGEKKRGFILDSTPVFNRSLDLSSLAPIQENVGDTIGRYKLLEKIGEGGMGVVYLAEQTSDVNRHVALKIIKLGMDTRQVIARFEAERQTLAMFDHPNITRVIDAGATSTGRPYFVMELVRGRDIVEYVTKENLSLLERLNIFCDVCTAVHHAHQKGIIHRDLKPSNILVTEQDGKAIPKVIDFGIAKAIHSPRLTDKTLFTRFSAIMGTPQYMSPEQAEMSGRDVDTRSDVYSLGVILYEMITGSTPISRETLRDVSPLALHETIRDTEVETPSARIQKQTKALTNAAASKAPATVASAGASTGASAATSPSTSSPALPKFNKGDLSHLTELDWIVLKSLSRERSKRYASANEFAADLTRFIQGEAVLAAPPSRAYRMRTYLRRHSRAIAVSLSFVALLLVSASLCLYFAIQTYRANQELTKTNLALSKNVADLELAKTQLRDAADQKQFKSAISIALLKFDVEFTPRYWQLASQLFPNQVPHFLDGDPAIDMDPTLDPGNAELGTAAQPIFITPSTSLAPSTATSEQAPANAEVKGVPTESTLQPEFDAVVQEGVLPENAAGVCLTYDRNELLQLPYADLLEPSLQRVREQIQLDEELLKQLQTNFGEDDSLNHEHSPECVTLRERARPIIRESSILFYRELVAQYRNAFGENDPRVAEGLNLWAASLIANSNLEEAEAKLREAIAIDGGKQKQVSEKLLAEVAKLKQKQNQKN